MDLSVPRPWLARNFYLLSREHLDYVQMWGYLRDFVMEMLSDKISEVLWWMNLKWPWSFQTHSWFKVSDVFILMKRKLATASFPAHTLPCCFFLPVSTLVSSLVSRMREADVHLSSTIAHLLKKKKKLNAFLEWVPFSRLLPISTYIEKSFFIMMPIPLASFPSPTPSSFSIKINPDFLVVSSFSSISVTPQHILLCLKILSEPPAYLTVNVYFFLFIICH